ncbi:MAG: RIP metalloprotease RseP [Acidobacteriota bacterium]
METVELFLGRLVSFLVVLSIVVIIHELGHFASAKFFRIRVDVFSMGFGRRIFGVRRGETDYRFSAIPLGGYVKLAGEQAEDATGKADEFQSHPRWQRIIVYVMGPTMNVVLSLGLFSASYMAGVSVPAYRDEPPRIGFVEADSPARKAGLAVGDMLLEIDGRKVPTWNDVDLVISTSPRKELRVTVERDGKPIDVPMTTDSKTRYSIGYAGFQPAIPAVVEIVSNGMPAARAGLQKGDRIVALNGVAIGTFQQMSGMIRSSPGKEMLFSIERGGALIEKRITPADEKGIGRIGVSPYQPSVVKVYSFFPAIGEGAKQCWEMSTLVLEILKKYARREMPLSSLSGPLDIAAISYSFASSGLAAFIAFVAAISLQLGIINMVPIPVLDGGHVFILLLESGARRDFSLKIKERILQVGFVLLVALMLFVVINDVVKFLPESMYKYVPWRD